MILFHMNFNVSHEFRSLRIYFIQHLPNVLINIHLFLKIVVPDFMTFQSFSNETH